jgi:hypothetical protein
MSCNTLTREANYSIGGSVHAGYGVKSYVVTTLPTSSDVAYPGTIYKNRIGLNLSCFVQPLIALL